MQSEHLSHLEVIFPFTTVETLEEALCDNYNVDFAINDLLSNADNGENPSASSKASGKVWWPRTAIAFFVNKYIFFQKLFSKITELKLN